MRTPLPLPSLLAGGAAVLLTTAPAVLCQDTSSTKQECSNSLDFGVDVSYPIHTHNTIADNPLGDKQTFYDHLLQGCKDSCSDCGPECQQYEDDRIAMNMRQPQSMVNYTDIGIKKIRAPDEVMRLLTEFWEANKGLEYPERWGKGNTYVNHWEIPSYMLSVENSDLEGGGPHLKRAIWDTAVKSVSEWTGQDLTTSSLYGIRVYKDGAVLAPHVDRLPLVSSAIINVAQDVDEPWPLEVFTHDGKAVNVTMEPGDLVLYESHSIVHGRPYPLKGRFFANVFIHFQPVLEDFDAMPKYIIPGSPEAKKWERENAIQKFAEGKSNEAHRMAAQGDLRGLQAIARSERSREMLFQADENGWTPLHEAARGGKVDALQLLLEEGADADARVAGGKSALHIAREAKHEEDSEIIVKVLKEAGCGSDIW